MSGHHGVDNENVVDSFVNGLRVISPFSTDRVDLIINDGEIQFLDNLLYVHDMHSLDLNELRILRNSIYAKHGYQFSSRDLQRHFAQFIWYAGTKDNVDTELSHIDKADIKLISRIEENLEEAQRDPELIGNWHYYPVMPSTTADHVKSFENGTFKYVFWASKIYGYVSFGGIYDTENDTLSLTH